MWWPMAGIPTDGSAYLKNLLCYNDLTISHPCLFVASFSDLSILLRQLNPGDALYATFCEFTVKLSYFEEGYITSYGRIPAFVNIVNCKGCHQCLRNGKKRFKTTLCAPITKTIVICSRLHTKFMDRPAQLFGSIINCLQYGKAGKGGLHSSDSSHSGSSRYLLPRGNHTHHGRQGASIRRVYTHPRIKNCRHRAFVPLPETSSSRSTSSQPQRHLPHAGVYRHSWAYVHGHYVRSSRQTELPS